MKYNIGDIYDDKDDFWWVIYLIKKYFRKKYNLYYFLEKILIKKTKRTLIK